jgi:hypothetical protein
MLATEFAEESRRKLSPADETPQAGARETARSASGS